MPLRAHYKRAGAPGPGPSARWRGTDTPANSRCRCSWPIAARSTGRPPGARPAPGSRRAGRASRCGGPDRRARLPGFQNSCPTLFTTLLSKRFRARPGCMQPEISAPIEARPRQSVYTNLPDSTPAPFSPKAPLGSSRIDVRKAAGAQANPFERRSGPSPGGAERRATKTQPLLLALSAGGRLQ
jgi:hypothetical protein